MWYVIERANGNFIAEFDTLEEAEYTVQEWEFMDEKFGEFTPLKYQIIREEE